MNKTNIKTITVKVDGIETTIVLNKIIFYVYSASKDEKTLTIYCLEKQKIELKGDETPLKTKIALDNYFNKGE